jgi:hypothetical protein
MSFMVPSVAPPRTTLYEEFRTFAREDSVNRDERCAFGDERSAGFFHFGFRLAHAPARRFHGVSDQLHPRGTA